MAGSHIILFACAPVMGEHRKVIGSSWARLWWSKAVNDGLANTLECLLTNASTALSDMLGLSMTV